MAAQKTPVKKKPGRPAKQPKAPPAMTKAQQARFEKKQAEALAFAAGVVKELFSMPGELRQSTLEEMKKEDPIIHALVREHIREQVVAARQSKPQPTPEETVRMGVPPADTQPEVQKGTFNVPGGPKVGYTVTSSRTPNIVAKTMTEYDKLLDRVYCLSRRLEVRVDTLREKLSPIILPAPALPQSTPPAGQDIMPPLFHELHKALDALNDQITRVSNVTEDVRL